MTWPDVWQTRLARHHLAQAAPRDDVPRVVADVCGIHAQVAPSAELSLGLRVDGLTRQHVRQALWQDRTLVKTFGLRGTIHLFPTSEIALWLAALRAKTPPRPPNKQELAALPPEVHGEMLEAMGDALRGQQLTRDELGQAIEQRLGAWANEGVWPAFGGQMPRWQLVLSRAAVDGVLAFGPPRANRVTYVRLDEWIGPLPQLDGKQALREVCRRFFAAYGPATYKELARWFTTTPAGAREMMAALGDELVEVDVEGWRAWHLASRYCPAQPQDGMVHLLPHFDCYVVGGFPREQLIPACCPPELQKGTAAPFAVLVVDGVVSGLWQRTLRGKTLEVRVDPFVPLSAGQKEETERQAQRIGEILESRVQFAFGHVAPRGHL